MQASERSWSRTAIRVPVVQLSSTSRGQNLIIVLRVDVLQIRDD